MKNDPVSGYPMGSPDSPIRQVLLEYGQRSLQQRAAYMPEVTEAEIYRVKLDVNRIQPPTMQHPLFLWFKWMTGKFPSDKTLEQFQQVLRWRLFAGKEHPVQELLHLGWYKMILSDILWEKEHGKPVNSDWE